MSGVETERKCARLMVKIHRVIDIVGKFLKPGCFGQFDQQDGTKDKGGSENNGPYQLGLIHVFGRKD